MSGHGCAEGVCGSGGESTFGQWNLAWGRARTSGMRIPTVTNSDSPESQVAVRGHWSLPTDQPRPDISIHDTLACSLPAPVALPSCDALL